MRAVAGFRNGLRNWPEGLFRGLFQPAGWLSESTTISWSDPRIAPSVLLDYAIRISRPQIRRGAAVAPRGTHEPHD